MLGALIPLALVATTMAQGVTQTIAPPGAAPAECLSTLSGQYELTVDAIEPGLAKRQEPVTNTLLITLKDGVLKDRYNRVGYIASNRQFQFDGPPQAGALYTGGWTLCQNGFLALGPSQVFYRCLSGEFYNLYDESLGAQCSKIHLVASQARPEVVSEVPLPAAGGAAPVAPSPVAPSPASTTPVSTTPAVIVPPASTTVTDMASSISSEASALSSSASSISASVSASGTSGSTVAGTGVLPPGATINPPVDPQQASGASIHVGRAAVSSMALFVAILAMIMN